MVTISQKLKDIGVSVGQKIASVVPFSEQITSAGKAVYSVAKYIPPVKLAVEKPAVSLGLAAAGVGVAVVGVPASIAAAKAVVPKTTKGKIIAGVAAPVVIGAVSQQPLKAAKTIASAPSELSQFGGDIANLAASPSLESAKELFKESPVLTTAALAAGAVALGKGVIPAIATARQTEAIQEQTAAIQAATAGLPLDKTGTGASVPASSLAPSIPVTPSTKTVEAGTQRRRRKIKGKMTTGNITQRVNVLVSNRNAVATKKYIRRNVLAY